MNIVAQTSKIHSGTVIFLHGSGGTGRELKEWIRSLLRKDMDFPQLKVMFPTAPLQPYSLLGGELSNVWFNRLDISPDSPEQLNSIDSMAQELSLIINKEVETGIPLNRIIVGGFSMGGAMSLHLAYRRFPQLRGVFALSSFLSHNSAVYEAVKNKPSSELPPLFMCHGDMDDMVPHRWGNEVADTLRKLGVDVQFHIIPKTMHDLRKREILQLVNWINEKLPSIS